MAGVTVWDERDDYTACTYRSILMVLVASGYTGFPLGAYTAAEAQAFRGGDSRLHFGGPVDRALNRYRVTVQSPTPYSQAGLRAALATPGAAYAVAGRTANFAAGHPIRRWDPVFSGFHAVCVIPLGGGLCLWLDPLAYTGYAGDTVTVSDITDIFAAGNYPNDARYLNITLGGDMTTIVAAEVFSGGNRPVDFVAGPVTGYHLDGSSRVFTIGTGGSWARARARCDITQSDGRAPNGYPFVQMVDGIFADAGPWYIVEDGVKVKARPDPVPVLVPSGFTQEEVNTKIREAIAALPAPPAPAPVPATNIDMVALKTNIALLSNSLGKIYTARSEAVRYKNIIKQLLGIS